MLSYPYIESVFKSVLAQSFVMQGRFYSSPHFGSELNTSNLEQVLERAIGNYKSKEYPLCLMLPPRSMGDYTSDHFKDEYQITLYFLTSTYRTTKNQIKVPNTDALVSQHPIVFDWHDMKRCAVNFIKVLSELSIGQRFFIGNRQVAVIDPISTIGNDNVSGVMITFNLIINELCALEDYTEDYTSKIILPEPSDIHPEHLH